MMDISDIPNIPDQDERIEAITVDCYGPYEELWAFYTCLEDAPTYPFEAIWRDVDEPGHAEDVTVLGVADADDRRGVLLRARRGDKERRIVAEQFGGRQRDAFNFPGQQAQFIFQGSYACCLRLR